MITALVGTVGGLLHAARLARDGNGVRVLRVGRLLGLGAQPLGRGLAAIRADLGPVGWVPRHARRLVVVDGRRVELDAVPDAVAVGLRGRGLAQMPMENWVLPARGWHAVEGRAHRAIEDAGGELIDAELIGVELEAGRVVGIETDCGFEWVEDLHTDLPAALDPDADRQPAEVELLGHSELPWELGFASGAVRRIIRDPIDSRRHRICLVDASVPRRDALAAVQGLIDVEEVAATRLGPKLGVAQERGARRAVATL